MRATQASQLTPRWSLESCSEGGCPSLAAGLIESGASEAAVNTAVARAKRIVQLCEAAELPELAEGYITNGVAEDAVREQLSAIAARMDSAEISSNIAPGARERPKAMSVREIYAERNKAHFKTTRQET